MDFTTTSGPMPQGSPIMVATMGLLDMGARSFLWLVVIYRVGDARPPAGIDQSLTTSACFRNRALRS
jgi:hypothetical protein